MPYPCPTQLQGTERGEWRPHVAGEQSTWAGAEEQGPCPRPSVREGYDKDLPARLSATPGTDRKDGEPRGYSLILSFSGLQGPTLFRSQGYIVPLWKSA